MNVSVIFIAVIIGIFLLFFVFYEKRNISAKEVSLVATMSAIAGVSRIPFAAFPNVQPTTFLVIVSGFIFGPFLGFGVGAMAGFVSNFFLGQGPWTPWQMLSWGIIGLLSGFLGKLKKRPSRVVLSVFSFLCGFIFNYIMNIWYWVFFIKPLNFESFVTVYTLSFYFDLIHGVCNFAFAFLLGSDFINVLSRFKKRISYVEENLSA